jgi:hypothetical protein
MMGQKTRKAEDCKLGDGNLWSYLDSLQFLVIQTPK